MTIGWVNFGSMSFLKKQSKRLVVLELKVSGLIKLVLVIRKKSEQKGNVYSKYAKYKSISYKIKVILKSVIFSWEVWRLIIIISLMRVVIASL